MTSLERTGRPAVGDTVRLEGWGVCTVIADDDPSTVRLRIEWTGREVRIGERALRLALLAAEGADTRPTT